MEKVEIHFLSLALADCWILIEDQESSSRQFQKVLSGKTIEVHEFSQDFAIWCIMSKYTSILNS